MSGKKWRKILKTMNLIEVLLDKGSNKFFTEMKKKTFLFEPYRNYTMIENGIEKG